ncbi:MAG: DUF4838 domain-containing protein [Planctomycetaceae bacterium]|nr:DUF4838 domain-containing protein [Planctomycetales bacterium]MCB9923570.1 DUF4838 domain-containing protein [Planctomycetaceae bacterium]
MIRSCLFLTALVCLASTVRAEFTLVDVEARVQPAPLVLFANAPPKTREAAVELADYIETICGVRPALMDGAPKDLLERAIWVGYQPALDALFPDADFDFQHPEEILIAANDNHLVIAGRDRWDAKHLIVEGIDEKIVGRQQEYGTVNAVYTFLQDKLGVRWFWPGELGEDVPRRKRITLDPFEFRYHPQIRARGGAFNFSALSNKGYGRSHQWTRRQRLQLDSLRSEGGHAFGDWHERFHETRPELFALQPDGTRGTHPSPKNVKLCQSNPAVWEQWLADVEAKLKKDPTLTEFNASPNDGWSSGHCICENCRAWDHPDGEPRLMHWHHHRETRPALSDRHVTFANKLAERLKQRYPDKDYRVMMLCYGHSRPAPIKARPAENVIMVSVANFFGRTHLVDRGSTWGTTHRDQLAAWGKLAHQVMWRPNTGSPVGWQQGLPDVSIAQTIENIQFAADNRCVGIYIDAVWEHWATQGPQYYVMAQLFWNPTQDGEKVLDDYYRRAFGPTAANVRAYFETIERARMAYVKEHGYGGGVFNFPRLYTDELLSESREHLRLAAAKVETAPEIYRRRVAFVRAGLTYSERLIETIRLMESYWRKQDDAVAAKVLANWQEIEQLCQANPFAINWGPVRPTTPRMIGLHPDHPNPKWKPNNANDLDQN